MDVALREFVRARADNRCEYCQLHQDDYPYARLHIEHIIPRQHGGGDAADNLALACMHCNLHKGPNIAGIDPETGLLTRLFHPRLDQWNTHFSSRGAKIIGISAIGRATVQVFNMNSWNCVRLREQSHGSAQRRTEGS